MLNDSDKSRSQLIVEVQELRAQLARFERSAEGDHAVPNVMARADGVTHSSQPEPLSYAQLAEALSRCEAMLAEVQHVAKMGYYSYDIVHNTTYRSPALLEMLGLEADHPEDMTGWLSIIYPDQKAMMTEYLTNLFVNRQNFDKEYQIIHGKSGESRWVHGLGRLRFDAAGRPIELFGTLQDITERKRAEESLVQSESSYRELIDGMKETVWVIDARGKFIDVNRTASEMLHYSREELLQMGPHDIDISISQTMNEQRENSFAQNRIRIFETTHIRKDGKQIPVEIQATRVTHHGQAAVLSIARDITERKAAEAALQKSEAMNQLLATVVRQASEAILITDLAGIIEYVNPAYTTMSGYAAEAMVGVPLPLLQQEELVDKAQRTPWMMVQQNETWHGRVIAQHKEGSSYQTDVTLFPIHDADGRISNYCQIARDISHELQLERQLNQAQRLETIGTLAGGIAHDFNNLLMPIMGYAEMAATKLPATDPLQTNLQQILKGAQRARELVRQILTFSRQHEQQRSPTDLHGVVQEVLKFIRPTLPSTIEIRQSLDPTCQQVLADAMQLHQVLVNLCTNAFHAMEAAGGVLTITLEQVLIDPTLAQLYPILQQQEYACLTVSDTGVGMDSVTLERIFEPFFTTKSIEQGTGLGLSVAHGIVTAHDGVLLAQSTLGQGTSFQIYLPIFADDVQTESAPNIPDAQDEEMKNESDTLAKQSMETILLVDDESTITDLIRDVLEWQGYQVEAYNNSLEALSVVQQFPNKFDLVLSDLTMPGLTGVELAGKLQKVHAGIPIIIITGYGNNLDEETQKSHGIRHVVSKPIGIDELSSLIRHVLDS